MVAARASVTALIPAAGRGERLGQVIPKALVRLDGRSIYEYALRPFLRCNQIGSVIVLAPKGCCKQFQEHSVNLSEKLIVIEGGDSRQQSVRIGLEYCRVNLLPAARHYVVIHDAARAFLSEQLLESVLNGLEKADAVTAALPAVDSLVQVDQDEKVRCYLDRSIVWQIQTPQAFSFDLIYQAHLEAKQNYSDDASLIVGRSAVSIVPGEVTNFKITTPADIDLAKSYIRHGI